MEACQAMAPESETSVAVASGRIAGTSEAGVAAWLGVPFAAPPVGSLRWRPPQPVASWSGVRQAMVFAPACMQTGVSMPGEAPPVTSEDCLYLNVWAPERADKLPVIVWIHGGGWANGATAMPLYSGANLARRGVVFVSIAYRLGPMGFLAHPELSAESGAATSGNYGLMDQVAALKWVQANIATFGGDPTRVTIAGQSAGAMSVSLLMASPTATGLFAGAIGQSGGRGRPVFYKVTFEDVLISSVSPGSSGSSAQPFRNAKDYQNFLGRVQGFTRWTDSAIASMREGMRRGVVQPRVVMLKVVPQLRELAQDDPEKTVFWQVI